MKLRLTVALLVLAAWAACAPAGAQASGCAAPVAANTSTTTTSTTTTPTSTGSGTTTTPTGTGTTTTPTTTTPGGAAPPASVRPSRTSLTFAGLFTVDGGRVSVPRRAVPLTVSVSPYVSGQRLVVTEALGGRRLKTVRLAARCVAGDRGRLTLDVRAPAPGRVSVTVSHPGNAIMTAFRLRGAFTALATEVHVGSRGRFVQLVQQRLAALHLFIPQTGVFDQGTELALDAYHRLLGDGEGDESLDARTLAELLDGDGRFHVRYPGQGEHAEGDLSDQLVAFIDGSQVHWIFPISSGKPSTPTILGQFQVYYKEPYYTSDGMYFSSFFHGGYAIHGYDPAPDYPASHGCMRLPMVDAIPAYNWMRVGDWVDTYYT